MRRRGKITYFNKAEYQRYLLVYFFAQNLLLSRHFQEKLDKNRKKQQKSRVTWVRYNDYNDYQAFLRHEYPTEYILYSREMIPQTTPGISLILCSQNDSCQR